MNLFRSEEHVKEWSAYEPTSEESIMPVADWAYALGANLFSKRLELDYFDRMDENWGDGANKIILKNYLDHTFNRIKYQEKITYNADKGYACFNTGLCTENQEDIYALFNKNKRKKYWC